MNRNLKISLLFFLSACGTLYLLFSLWAHKEGLLSPEAYFFSFQAHGHSGEHIKNLFLTYPVLPSIIAFLHPSAPFVTTGAGILVILLSLLSLFPVEPLSLSFLLAIFASPFFLTSLCTTPTLLLFFVFLLSAFFHFLRYQEEQMVYHLFLGSILFGITFLIHPHAGWFSIAITLAVFLLFPGNIKKRTSLLVVILFPGFTFLGITAFLNWIYTGNALSFFDSSYSFLSHLPSFSWANWKHTGVQFYQWFLFLGPLLVGTFREKRRFFWSIVLGTSVMA
ncbi:MAG: hypothetical protein N2Z84_00415, partial [Atribacterota bacterium]|nr:hypothetical protein [Atribacterota bacterium]